jgi:hypothetical protein
MYSKDLSNIYGSLENYLAHVRILISSLLSWTSKWMRLGWKRRGLNRWIAV